MRVGIDVSPLRQTRAGTARHLRALLAQLEVLADFELVPLAFGGGGRVTAFARDVAWYPFGLPRRAAHERIDVLHCPTYRGPVRCAVPIVVTVHDLAVFRHPETFNRWSRTYSRAVVPRVLAAARIVIAVSEFTRHELREILGVPDEKLRVVPNAVGPGFEPGGAVSDGDYVLAVGTLEPRKNLLRLVEATRRAGVELRVVGAPGWGGVELSGENGVRWLGEVPDARLAELYRGAACVAYPSLYEGFGMPVLEAMACGVPVVTSAGGATEEVAGGAAVLVDPLDPASIAAGLEEASARRDELTRLGLERARAFSWAETAAATAEVYREALS
jgi:glycosyltransferase involved in cell wall biosynthesis